LQQQFGWFLRICRFKAKIYYACSCICLEAENHFTKVTIKCENDPLLVSGSNQNVFVRASWRIRNDRYDIVSGSS